MAIVAGSLIFRPNRCVRIGRSCGRVLYIGVTERKSHLARIIKILERDGQISRNQCRSMFPASTRLGALSENEEAVRDLRRTVFSSQCQPIAGSLKQTFYCLILTGQREP
jgi:hypothetical protein